MILPSMTSSNTNVKPTWPAVTCLVVGNSILTAIDVKRLSKPNQFGEVCKFSGATIDDLKRYLVPLPKNEANNIFLHVGINDAILKTSGKTLDELLQWEQHITSILPDSKVIILKPTLHTDNG